VALIVIPPAAVSDAFPEPPDTPTLLTKMFPPELVILSPPVAFEAPKNDSEGTLVFTETVDVDDKNTRSTIWFVGSISEIEPMASRYSPPLIVVFGSWLIVAP